MSKLNVNEVAVEIAKAIVGGSEAQNRDIVTESERSGVSTARGIAIASFEIAQALADESRNRGYDND